METLQGIAVFPGVAIGPALVLNQEGHRISRQHVARKAAGREIQRLDRCLVQLAEEIRQNTALVSERLGPEVARIFEAHRGMIADPHLRQLIVERIEKECSSAEFAVQEVLDEYAEFFRKIATGHFAERASDIQDIQQQILSNLVGEQLGTLGELSQESVVLAPDLTPSQTASFNPSYVRGIATESGGRTSHTAIIAGAMEIPAVVGLGRFPDALAEGQTVIIDGNRGVLIVDPDEETLQRYRTSAADFRRFEESLGELRDLPAVTLDGVTIRLLGNIEFAQEAAHCIDRGAEGIGLYRTEFLYLDPDSVPGEDAHYRAYADVLRTMGPERPVVFRTMDLGADKLSQHFGHPHEPNPVLGLRSVRLSLRHLPMFKTQLRALLRASTLGNVRIMFPLVSTVMELRRCRMIVADVMEDLEEEGVAFRRDVPIGMMVEVPSAALLADRFAPHVAFFSIGTNDLIQYTMAVDRTNETVASLYSASDPAVLRLVHTVVRAANRAGIEVSVCGEMSGDPIYTMLLLGIGLRQLSVTPHNIPEIKKIIRSITLAEAREIAASVRRFTSAREVTNFLRNRTRKILPELIDDLGD